MRKDSSQTTQQQIQTEGPFKIIKDYRGIQLKKRRKLLRNLNKANKIALLRRRLLNSNQRQIIAERPRQIKYVCTAQEEFNMFFEQSANLPQQENQMRNNFFTSDFDFKEESDLFSTSTVVEEKHSLYVQQFAKFEFKGIC